MMMNREPTILELLTNTTNSHFKEENKPPPKRHKTEKKKPSRQVKTHLLMILKPIGPRWWKKLMDGRMEMVILVQFANNITSNLINPQRSKIVP